MSISRRTFLGWLGAADQRDLDHHAGRNSKLQQDTNTLSGCKQPTS